MPSAVLFLLLKAHCRYVIFGPAGILPTHCTHKRLGSSIEQRASRTWTGQPAAELWVQPSYKSSASHTTGARRTRILPLVILCLDNGTHKVHCGQRIKLRRPHFQIFCKQKMLASPSPQTRFASPVHSKGQSRRRNVLPILCCLGLAALIYMAIRLASSSSNEHDTADPPSYSNATGSVAMNTTHHPTFYFIGDSITELGSRLGTSGWVALMQEQYVRSVVMVNRGVSGSNTRYVHG